MHRPEESEEVFCENDLSDSETGSDADTMWSAELQFERFEGWRVVAAFDGGAVTSAPSS